MNHCDYCNPTFNRNKNAPHTPTVLASARAQVKKHSDAILGSVAIGGSLVVMAWVVTGIELFAIVAVLIAMAAVSVARTLPRRETSFGPGRTTDCERIQDAGVPARHALHATRGRSAYRGLDS